MAMDQDESRYPSLIDGRTPALITDDFPQPDGPTMAMKRTRRRRFSSSLVSLDRPKNQSESASSKGRRPGNGRDELSMKAADEAAATTLDIGFVQLGKKDIDVLESSGLARMDGDDTRVFEIKGFACGGRQPHGRKRYRPLLTST